MEGMDPSPRTRGAAVADLIAAAGGGAHPWGPVGSWPAGLRAAADLVLGSPVPMLVAWGEDLRLLYNDACVPLLGDEHPAAFGEPLGRVRSGPGPAVAPLVGAARSGRAATAEDLALVVHRDGHPEEVRATASCSPVGDGRDGVLCVLTDTTERVAELRRALHLQAATAALSAAATPRQVAAAVVEGLGRLLGTPAVAVWQQHGEDLLEQLDLGGWRASIRALWPSLPVDAMSPAGAAAASREPVWTETEDDWLGRFPRLLPMVREHGYTSIDCLPLLAGGRCLGVVAVGFEEERRLDGNERAAVVALVEQAALALRRAGLLIAETEGRTAAEEFGRVVAALSGATTPTEVAGVVLAHAVELGARSAVLVVRAAGPSEHLRVLCASDPAVDGRLPLDAPHPLAHAVRTGEPVWVGSRSGWAWRDRSFADGASALPGQVALPLVVGGDTVGAVGLHFGDELPVVDPARRTTLLTIAGQCAQALDRARLHQAEHEVAATLQRSLLPSELPGLERIAAAARYLPGAEGVQAGGDWYDMLPVAGPDGEDGTRVAMAVGDVVGQGAPAAAVMGQLRSALAGYLLDGHPPAAALERLDRFAARVPGAAGSTCACLVLDWSTGELTWATAGHPPVLVVERAGARYLTGGTGTVLGVRGRPPYAEATGRIAAGTSVVLYTDGLVERRDEVIDGGLERLRAAADDADHHPPAALVDLLVRAAVDHEAPSDDIAAVVVRLGPAPLALRAPARPAVLREVRRAVTAWAEQAGLPAEQGEDLELAVGEAASNSLEHAGAGSLTVEVRRCGDGAVAASVRDDGHWRPPPADAGFRGHGLRVIRRLAASFDLLRGDGGTEVRVRLAPAVAEAPRPARAPAPRPAPAAGDGAVTRLVDEPDALRVEGDLDHDGAAAVRGALLSRLGAPGAEALDLTGVGHLTSAGIALVLEARRAAPGLALRVAPGSAPARVLRLAGLDELLVRP